MHVALTKRAEWKLDNAGTSSKKSATDSQWTTINRLLCVCFSKIHEPPTSTNIYRCQHPWDPDPFPLLSSLTCIDAQGVHHWIWHHSASDGLLKLGQGPMQIQHSGTTKHMSQGRSTPCIGDGGPPTFNRESLFHGYINPYCWVDEFIPYYMEI